MMKHSKPISPELIAETAFTHEGNLEYMFQLIKLASSRGFTFIKFQIIIDVDSVYSHDSKNYKEIKNKVFNQEQWIEIFDNTKSLGLRIIALPIDYQAIHLIHSQISQIDYIEIHSIALNDIKFLDVINEVINQDVGLMLGIGGRNLADIEFCIDYLFNKNIVLMYGIQNFPTQKNENNLLKIKFLNERFNYPIGFADHTPHNEDDSLLLQTALLLGCTFIEKHIILKAGDSRSDYYSAIDEKGIKRIFTSIEELNIILGNGNLNNLSVAELRYKNRERKIVACEDLKPGDYLTYDSLTYKVVSQLSEIEPKSFVHLIGKEVIANIQKGSAIKLRDIK